MNKWDERFLGLAEYVAQWSKDPSSQTGAVIVDTNKRIVAFGFNGFPQGIEDTEERLNNRQIKYEIIVHSEENAILFAQRSLDGCTLYTWPFMPCSRCAAKVIQVGIKRVVAARIPVAVKNRWGQIIDSADLFGEAGVEYVEAQL